ncbi:MAG: tRNA (adenosine(37)-N6)-dimethylallyltransferase MiaA [Mycobacteriaceae bacterium]
MLRPLVLVGPTATGKSALALDVALRVQGEIVNADAMQQYRGMDVGTAKTPVDQRRGVPHHQLDVLHVAETATVARYQHDARADVEALLARGVQPVVVGGSGLYVTALLDELAFPATDPVVRARWELRLAEVGSASLHSELARSDPEAAAKLLPSDGRRVVRALEVGELTGRPFSASAPRRGAPRWDAIQVGLDRDSVELDQRVEQRVDDMFDAGLLTEVRALLEEGLADGVTAKRALGYAQALALLDGELDEPQARASTAAGTRRYVRRQRSWFRRDGRVQWFDAARPDLTEAVLAVF